MTGQQCDFDGFRTGRPMSCPDVRQNRAVQWLESATIDQPVLDLRPDYRAVLIVADGRARHRRRVLATGTDPPAQPTQHLSARVRLTLLYTSLFAACGGVLVTVTYVLLSHNLHATSNTTTTPPEKLIQQCIQQQTAKGADGGDARQRCVSLYANGVKAVARRPPCDWRVPPARTSARQYSL
jgi:hypothetical protein